jgi:hypothetical protein
MKRNDELIMRILLYFIGSALLAFGATSEALCR